MLTDVFSLWDSWNLDLASTWYEGSNVDFHFSGNRCNLLETWLQEVQKAARDVEESPKSMASPKPRGQGVSRRETSSDIPGAEAWALTCDKCSLLARWREIGWTRSHTGLGIN